MTLRGAHRAPRGSGGAGWAQLQAISLSELATGVVRGNATGGGAPAERGAHQHQGAAGAVEGVQAFADELAGAGAPPPPAEAAAFFAVAFLRDPVERFLAGFEEATYRLVGEARKAHAGEGADIDDKAPWRRRVPAALAESMDAHVREAEPRLRDVEGVGKGDISFRIWREWWARPQALALFDEYVALHHRPEAPFDTHLRLQSYMIASKVEALDFVGRVESLTDDWSALAARFGARPGYLDRACLAGEEDGKKQRGFLGCGGQAPQLRLNPDHSLAPQRLDASTLKLVCAHVQPDAACLGLESKWCSGVVDA